MKNCRICWNELPQQSTSPSETIMSQLKCFPLVIALLHCSRIVAQCDEPVRRTEDVIYGRKFGMALTMDVFQPAQPNGCGLLFLVNGGWLSSKATPLMVTIRPDDYRVYLERGYTVFAVVTSSQPKFAIPELMEDVQRAVRFIRANANKYGVRPDRLGVLGSSSGGHLALSIATRGGPGKADSTDPVERESSAVQAAACFFPPTDFLNYGGPGISGVGEGPLAPLKVAFGPRALTLEGRESLGREISPQRLPRVLQWHANLYHWRRGYRCLEELRRECAPAGPVERGRGWADRLRNQAAAARVFRILVSTALWSRGAPRSPSPMSGRCPAECPGTVSRT